jgi:hypothetical protein
MALPVSPVISRFQCEIDDAEMRDSLAFDGACKTLDLCELQKIIAALTVRLPRITAEHFHHDITLRVRIAQHTPLQFLHLRVQAPES